MQVDDGGIPPPPPREPGVVPACAEPGVPSALSSFQTARQFLARPVSDFQRKAPPPSTLVALPRPVPRPPSMPARPSTLPSIRTPAQSPGRPEDDFLSDEILAALPLDTMGSRVSKSAPLSAARSEAAVEVDDDVLAAMDLNLCVPPAAVPRPPALPPRPPHYAGEVSSFTAPRPPRPSAPVPYGGPPLVRPAPPPVPVPPPAGPSFAQSLDAQIAA